MDNHLPLAVYDRCRDDVIYAEGMPVGLSGPAIETALRRLMVEPEDELEVFDLVKLIGRVIAAEVMDDHKRKMDAQPKA